MCGKVSDGESVDSSTLFLFQKSFGVGWGCLCGRLVFLRGALGCVASQYPCYQLFGVGNGPRVGMIRLTVVSVSLAKGHDQFGFLVAYEPQVVDEGSPVEDVQPQDVGLPVVQPPLLGQLYVVACGNVP